MTKRELLENLNELARQWGEVAVQDSAGNTRIYMKLMALLEKANG